MGGFGNRVTEVLPTEPPDAFPPGSRLIALTPLGSCTGGDGRTYDKYEGSVL